MRRSIGPGDLLGWIRAGRHGTAPGMDIAPLFPPADEADAGLSALARGVVGSEILRIAGEIRALKARGAAICNLTVGDFDPAYFPIPAELLEGTRTALAEGHTNYP